MMIKFWSIFVRFLVFWMLNEVKFGIFWIMEYISRFWFFVVEMFLDFVSLDFNLLIFFLLGNVSLGRFLEENCFLIWGILDCFLFKGFLRILFNVFRNLFVFLVLCVSIVKVFWGLLSLIFILKFWLKKLKIILFSFCMGKL